MLIDFHTNKKNLEEVVVIPSKCIRNKIVGFSTHLMKRIQKGLVIGISLKLQEEEKVRRMDFVPDESAIKTDRIEEEREPPYGFQSFATKVPVVFDNPEEFVGDRVITSEFYI